MKNFLALLFLIFLSVQSYSQNQLIPKPQKIEMGKGEFTIPETLVLSRDLPKAETDYFKNRLSSILKFQYTQKNGIHLTYSIIPGLSKDDQQKKEYYSLEISPKQIHVKSYTNQGYFLALQTLIQLFEEHKTDKKIPAMTIEDQPKLAWRGMHLDVCRHFFSVDEVKQYIDYLAMYKLNIFHWHLTDDQAWRIEIKKYPKLTQVGSKRKESMIGAYVDNTFDGKPYGPFFYTQEQIKEVVKYAQERHITVVPEIEMPGHALA
ncbi:family 20 glycosylhydrolase, partial [uncultured Chryseobacterium sp.]|uniref:family 20 glycosylhydrolase n=1 Tax=uncultured Chryseobacterium sp. TaxID=259322 RepID=UPI00260BAE2A